MRDTIQPTDISLILSSVSCGNTALLVNLLQHNSNDMKQPAGEGLGAFHGILTRAPEMQPIFRLIRRVAATDCTVLVRGETGSGKELVARAIHGLSARRQKQFQPINCATFSPTLLESELFGHVRGAFTGAVSDRPGLFKLADQGTVFLDEIGEIPLEIQARLLRVLEDKTFVPVGGTKPVQVDVRLISATNKALRREVAAGRFREDLLYRIRVVPIFLPPLRKRTGDIEALTRHFIDQFNQQGLRRIETISPDALEAMKNYPWPGNVRELRNVIEHAFIIGEGKALELQDLTPELHGEPPPGEELEIGSLRLDERERLRAILNKYRGRKGAAAAELGISRSTLWRKLYQYNLR
jgi:transcriptional regulator with PAS, ATPase and Fis domain